MKRIELVRSGSGGCVPAAGAARLGLFFTLSLLLGGCATYSETFTPVERKLAAQQPEHALQLLEKRRHSRRDEVLYLLNKGMLLRMTRDYEASNQAFEAAKRRINELYGASITEQAASFIINDGTRSFVGAEFEQVLVHLYMALNYLEMRQLDQARVEALQVDIRLREIAEHVPESAYTEDAFARYLTGIIYEERGEWSDAMIAYRKAYQSYNKYHDRFGTEIPVFLKYDLLRLSERMGLTQELARYKREFSISQWQDVASLRRQGELIFMLHNGLAPKKREQSAMVINPQSGRLIRVSLPEYQPRPQPVLRARLIVDGDRVRTQVAEDITGIAIKSLEAKMPAITARAVARAVLKDQTAKQAGKQHELAGLMVNLMNVMTERADTRSWATLPGNIHFARLPLPPGNYAVKVELLGSGDAVLATRELSNITIRAGEKNYYSYHWIPSRL